MATIRQIENDPDDIDSEEEDDCLPSPELYVIVKGKPTKQKVVWCSIVNVNALRASLRKLKEINWLYKQVPSDCIDDVARQVVETVDSTTSTMIVKASKEDVASYNSYTIRCMNEVQSTSSDIEQYKLMDVKDAPLDNRLKFLDVMCFPHLFPSGRFGEFHTHEVKLSSSEYAKSRLLNRDSRFRKDPQYVFFLLWQKEMREIAAGIYNLLKAGGQRRIPVSRFMAKLTSSDQEVEGNLSTMFQSVRGSRQYWFLRSSELKCMLREWGHRLYSSHLVVQSTSHLR